MNIVSELHRIGLNKSEISIYVFLVQNGQSSVANVSRETKISRTNCYYVFKQLIEKELIEELEVKNKKEYRALDPMSVVNYSQRNLFSAQKMLPDLYGIYSYNKNKPTVSFAENVEDITSLLGEILLSDDVQIIGSTAILEKVVPNFYKYFELNINTKKTQVRFIRNESLPVLTITWGTNTTIFSNSEPYTATTIKSLPITELITFFGNNVSRETK